MKREKLKTAPEKLKTVSNYAKSINCTPAWVYKLIKNKKIKTKIIDGVIFIVL